MSFGLVLLFEFLGHFLVGLKGLLVVCAVAAVAALVVLAFAAWASALLEHGVGDGSAGSAADGGESVSAR